MFQGILQSSSIPVLEQVVQFTQARHEVLAGNVANLHTPGYKARDLSVDDFQSRLRQAIDRKNQPAPASPGQSLATPEPVAQVAENSKSILFHDGSNIAVEQQVTEMVKNQMEHNMAMTILASQFRLMQTAISERV